MRQEKRLRFDLRSWFGTRSCARARGAAARPAAMIVAAMIVAAFTTLLLQGPALAKACNAEDFGNAVDEAGARLRAFNAEASPKLQSKLMALKDRKGWTGGDAEDKVHNYLHDERLEALDQQANELLINIDALGRPPENAPPDCSKLDELRAASSELLTVMRTKSTYMIAKIDGEIGKSAESVSSTKPTAATPKPDAKPAGKPAESESPVASSPSAVALPPKPVAPKADGWRATTAVVPPSPPPAQSALGQVPGQQPAATGGAAPPLPSEAFTPLPDDDGYTIDEIREVTRGLFGTVSTGLASVIEHAFRKSGRPSAYILGQEGGGAFLAGLRYGNGTLYPRRGGPRPIYWHGPSVGYDFGAAGSRALFLIYGLQNADAIHRRFTGIDGSAYLVGGVGITFLKGGDVTMAPIRSGLGLRIGASVGYLRFSAKPTWNPF